jgi:hypothetical protein
MISGKDIYSKSNNFAPNSNNIGISISFLTIFFLSSRLGRIHGGQLTIALA